MTGRERLGQAFETLRAQGRKGLITYITAGDPDLAATEEIAATLAENGVDLIELGLPFSDPMADGPVIQAASQRALQAGTTLEGVLATVAAIRERTRVPLAIMSYYNPIFRFGINRFVSRSARAGLDALIVPDLPLEEGKELQEAADAAGLEVICFLAPTSTPERIAQTARLARGFIYCISLTGITGEREEVAAGLADFIAHVRRYTDTPLAVGFGISNPGQAREVARFADAVIVGSALVRIIGTYGNNRERLLPQVARFTRDLRRSLDGSTAAGSGRVNRLDLRRFLPL